MTSFRLNIFMMIVVLLSCNPNKNQAPIHEQQISSNSNEITIQQTGSTINTRINTPTNFNRVESANNTFQHYLRTLKLKPVGSKVRYFDGSEKSNTDVYHSVVDLAVGKRDLHQCADAIIRLRAEYLWHQKEYDQIHFNFTNGFRVDYTEWMQGKRIKIEGNKTSWNNRYNPSNSYKDFWKYMELIFAYAGTASLEKELLPVEIENAKIGDILIQGGHPGHAVIIVDKALNQTNNKALYLLAQSYMPAQELQILKNPTNTKISPWYELKEGTIDTPEWTFSNGDLKSWKE